MQLNHSGLAPDAMTRRLVVVSNRTAVAGPVGGRPGGEARSGGLAVALREALRARGGLWFGWSGELSDTVPDAPRLLSDGGIDFALTDLTPAEHAGYYLGYANRVLWPLLHYRVDLAHTDRAEFGMYEAVNRRFARQLAPLLRRGDMVWVHDYHLLPLGRALHAAGWRGTTGFFLYTPFPAPEIFSALPQHARLARALADYDVVGLQTERDADNLRRYLAERRRMDTAQVTEAAPRAPRIAAFPVGIDPDEVRALSKTPDARATIARIRRAMPDRALVLGVDRMDYSKGLPQRLCAFERLLEQEPGLRRRVELVQIAAPSRAGVDAYRDVAAEAERIAGRINGAWGDLDWTPVRYLARCYPREVLSGLFRAARVGLVTPLRDGMNLVAKEYVAAQDPEDPGVLVLSRFAGAAAQMAAALPVNPYDADGVAAAIRQALEMPLGERRRRWQALDAGIRREDVAGWCRNFLAALEAAHREALPRRPRFGMAEAV